MKYLIAACFTAGSAIVSAQIDTCPFRGPNLIVNGDFEQGYYGFTSDFGRGVNNATKGGCATQGWILVAQIFPHASPSCQIYPPDLSAQYGGPDTQTSSDPNHVSNTAVITTAICNYPLEDHTTGSGFFLTIDPDAVTGRAFWKQTVTVCPNTDYVFSVWVRNISGIPAPYFHFEVGGVNINTPTSYPDGFWVNTAAKWNSGNVSGTVLIELVNDLPGCIENDVAIDDLFFGICGGAYLTCDTLYRFCSNEAPAQIMLSGSSFGFSPAQYQWQKRNPSASNWVNIPGATDSVFVLNTPTTADAGAYRMTVATDGNISLSNCSVATGTVQVTVLPVYSIAENVNICTGATYMGYSASGVYADSFQTIHGCDSVRTLHLSVQPEFTSNLSLRICEGETHSGYTESGIYTDTLRSIYGCDSIRTLDLTVHETHLTKQSLTICPGTSIIFNNQAISSTGIYKDTLGNIYGCDSIIVLDLTVPSGSFLGGDTTICIGNAFRLVSPSENTVWFDNSVSREKTITDSGIYWATLTDANGCKITDTVSVQFNIKSHIPNVFSPNDDGFNDTFVPDFSEFNFQSYHFQVFDRWGDLLFSTHDPVRYWDGKSNGKDCSAGVYVYFISVETGFCRKTLLKGDVSIVR